MFRAQHSRVDVVNRFEKEGDASDHPRASVDWQVEGKELIVASRTAFADETGGVQRVGFWCLAKWGWLPGNKLEQFRSDHGMVELVWRSTTTNEPEYKE